jgi:hypothetical protein
MLAFTQNSGSCEMQIAKKASVFVDFKPWECPPVIMFTSLPGGGCRRETSSERDRKRKHAAGKTCQAQVEQERSSHDNCCCPIADIGKA